MSRFDKYLNKLLEQKSLTEGRYELTVSHSSISRARQIKFDGTLDAAKRAAIKEFGKENQDYKILILDTEGDTVAQKLVKDRYWS